MKWLKEENISLLSLLGTVFIIFLLMISIGYIVILKEYRDFEKESKQIEKKYIENQKLKLKTEVNRVIDYINYYKSQTEQRLKNDIRHRVFQAYWIAEYIYNKYKDKESVEEIKARIKDALKPLRWREGYSYMWIIDYNGTAVLYPVNPKIEGTNVISFHDASGRYILKEAIDLSKQYNEGFIKNISVAAANNPNKIYKQIAFVKEFEPFNWVIGTGETIDDVESNIKREILKRISQMRYNKEGYFGVVDFDGTVLSHPFLKPGTSIKNIKDSNQKPVMQRLAEAAFNDTFLTYKFRKLTTPEESDKITYVKPIKEWGWLVFSGVYLDEIKDAIEIKRTALNKELIERISNIVIVFGVFTLIAIALSLFFSKHIEDIFKKYKKRIELRTKRLEELNKILKQKEQQALAANRAKTLFISNISHDIRTPLNAILGYAQILSKDNGLSVVQKEKIDKILKSGNYLLEILDDVIEISKIETGNIKINKEYFDLKSFLENIKELFEERAAAKGLGWEVKGIPESETYVYGDKKKLFRILINLISNAFKFTDFGNVTLEVKKVSHNRYRFIVKDTGIGIKKRDQEDIYQIFTQAEAGMERGGKGLGLSIAYKYVSLLGGELKLKSEPGKGSCFYFDLELESSLSHKQVKKDIPEQKNEPRSDYKDDLALHIPNKIKKDILTHAKLGHISSLKLAISSIEESEIKNLLMQYVNTYDMDGLIKLLQNNSKKGKNGV
ncbi:cache domain-containing protein [Nitrosophilus alvini]|uniref:cache domain-containing protein n=1 Tax=Nitrosophilus alvini TaxID=2714855 RepID=UPI00190CF67F|nr:cache domain-containing protein [Nitrosophilus alvini]